MVGRAKKYSYQPDLLLTSFKDTKLMLINEKKNQSKFLVNVIFKI